MKSFSLKSFLTLIKFRVSLAVTFTAATGYIVFAGNADIRLIQLAIGVFILASGSGALNEFQERKYDAKMPRTCHRPIPAGQISSINALILSVLLIFEGLYLLFSVFGEITALLGLFNIFWYNGLYTNLKRITAYAVIPGSLVGAVPVFMGWTAAGGQLFNSTVVFIAFFIFIWQVPHFWLLMLKYGKEYEEAGFPTINQSINPAGLRKIIFSWIVATSFSSLLIPLFLLHSSLPLFISIFVLNMLFISVFAKLSFGEMAELNLRKSFVSINVYMLVFMIMLIAFHLLSA